MVMGRRQTAPKWQLGRDAWKAVGGGDPASVAPSEKRKHSRKSYSPPIEAFKYHKEKQKKTNVFHANCAPIHWLPFQGLLLHTQFSALVNTRNCLDSIKKPQKRKRQTLGP